MEQPNYTTEKKKYKHILYEDRIIIERMLGVGRELSDIIEVIGCSPKTLDREIKRGTWEYLDGKTYEKKSKYSWDVGQRKHYEKSKNKGRYAKINDSPELRAFLEKLIKKEKYSPEAALLKAKSEGFAVDISAQCVIRIGTGIPNRLLGGGVEFVKVQATNRLLECREFLAVEVLR